ncbi:MAG: glycerol-3-phosphate acyltransferase [Actinobacteria bacterium]|nr:glycerol-3-phosphate acyltransferase [Actinomycetota bacterium]
MDAVAFVGVVVLGYLLGTIPFAVIVTALATRGDVDIRATGSGNPGGFNTFRSVGKVWGGVVVLLDGGKAMFAGLIALVLVGDAAAYAAATAAIVGHIWPVWTGFRGGKGVAAAGGAILGVFPAWFVPNLVALGLGVMVFRRSRPAMLLGMGAWVVAACLWTAFAWPNLWGPDPAAGLVAFSVLGAGMVVLKFRLADRDVSASG